MNKSKDKKPLIVCAEWTRVCNLRCKMCVMSAPGFPKTGHMSLKMWELLLESCRRDDAIIKWVHWHGEPFLWKNFFQGMALWKESGLASRGMIATNAQAITDDQIECLAETGIKGVRVGLDTTDPEIYKKHRIGGDFNKAISNIKKLLKITPTIIVEVLFLQSSVNQNINFEELYKLVGRPENLVPHIDWCYSTGGDATMTYKHNPSPDPRTCLKLERVCMVTFDGRVGICCWDAWCENLLGKFPDTPSIRELYYGAYAERVRKNIRKGDYSLAPACKKCSMDSDYMMKLMHADIYA
jgi:MoaA/NifB/PqqE/SkfB family radical SAM enzyme